MNKTCKMLSAIYATTCRFPTHITVPHFQLTDIERSTDSVSDRYKEARTRSDLSSPVRHIAPSVSG